MYEFLVGVLPFDARLSQQIAYESANKPVERTTRGGLARLTATLCGF